MYFHLTSTLAGYSNDLMSFFIVPLLFLIFHETENGMKARKGWLKSTMKYLCHQLGVNTLQIYVLQYFAINWCVILVRDSMGINLAEEELFLSPIIGVLLSMVCVGMSYLLHKARLGFLFGR